MPTISNLKKSVISALRKNPDEGSKPQLKRRVIPFDEAFSNLKTSKSGVVICVAFHSFGKCRKEIALPDSDFFANLGQLNMADVQTPIKLMPLMLCSSHWKKTIYYNLLFLDWLSTYGLKQDNQHYESIVVDYQSAVAIHDQQASVSSIPMSLEPLAEDLARLAAENNASTDKPSHMGNTDQLRVQDGCNKPLPSEPEHDLTSGGIPAVSVLMSMDAFASVESGVAKLEIMYQDNLRCIAMTSNGWRCQEIIHQEQLLKARELLCSSVGSEAETDIASLPPLVLCPGHAKGDLPRIYAERWTSFAEKRLPKEEAMRKFNSEFWLSVQFFPASLANMERRMDAEKWELYILQARGPRSVSTISAEQREENNLVSKHIVSKESAGRDTLWPSLKVPVDYHFGVFRPEKRFSAAEWKAAFEKPTFLDGRHLFEARSADDLRSSSALFETPTIISLPVTVPQPTVDKRGTIVELDNVSVTASESDHSDTSISTSAAFTSLKIADELPHREHNTFSVPKVVTEEGIPLEAKSSVENEAGTVMSRQISEETAHEMTKTHYQSMVDSSHSNIIKEIDSPIRNGGWLTIFSSQDRKLVKIGKATSSSCRKQQIRLGCQVPDSDDCKVDFYWVWYPERVTKLVHLELLDFQAKIDCQHHHQDGYIPLEIQDEHQQWFDVSEDVAVTSVKLWHGFVNQAYTPEGKLTEHWVRMLDLLPKPTDAETEALEAGLGAGGGTHLSDYHLLRHKRYSEWVEEGERSSYVI